MITFLAPLVRGFRTFHVPAPRPAASIHYTMPRTRCLFAGVSVSAMLHAGLFFGLSNDKPPVQISPDDLTTICALPLDTTITIEPLPPPSDSDKPDEEKTEPKPNPNDDFARLPDLPPSGALKEVTIEIPVPDVGRRPDFTSNLPKIPDGRGRGGPGVSPGDKIWDPKDLDCPPKVTFSVPPRYPSDLRTAGLAGDVLVRFVVTPKGDVRNVVVLSADHLHFGDAAVEAVARWRFEPGMKNKHKVSTVMELPLRFLVAN